MAGAAIGSGLYGLTASQRDYESEEEFKRRRRGGMVRTGLLGGIGAGLWNPAKKFMAGPSPDAAGASATEQPAASSSATVKGFTEAVVEGGLPAGRKYINDSRMRDEILNRPGNWKDLKVQELKSKGLSVEGVPDGSSSDADKPWWMPAHDAAVPAGEVSGKVVGASVGAGLGLGAGHLTAGGMRKVHDSINSKVIEQAAEARARIEAHRASVNSPPSQRGVTRPTGPYGTAADRNLVRGATLRTGYGSSAVRGAVRLGAAGAGGTAGYFAGGLLGEQGGKMIQEGIRGWAAPYWDPNETLKFDMNGAAATPP
jgi:hypothetical protein